MESKFTIASTEIKKLSEDPFSNEQKLKIYSLYKQATVGDCNISKPGILNPTGRAKWNAWNDIKGKDKESAMNEYVEFVKKYLPENVQAQL